MVSWRRKRRCTFWSFDFLKFLSVDLPPIRPRLMTWSESLLIIDKLFTIRALWWFVRCLCAYSQRKLWQGSSSCVTFEIVIGLDDWRVNSSSSPHVSSSVFNALHSIFCPTCSDEERCMESTVLHQGCRKTNANEETTLHNVPVVN